MANRAVFVGDFRGAVTAMIDAYTRVASLALFAQTMQWGEEEFNEILSGSDISGADMAAAIASVGTLAQTFGSEAIVLAKLKP